MCCRLTFKSSNSVDSCAPLKNPFFNQAVVEDLRTGLRTDHMLDSISSTLVGSFLLIIGWITVWHCVLPPKAKKFLRECLRRKGTKKQRVYKKARSTPMSAID